MSYGSVLHALGDPTRRSILERLRTGELAAGDVGRDLPMSQPAVSRHLRILREAGLVCERRAGTRRIYALDQDGLTDVRAWIEGFWDEPLVAFRRHAETTYEGKDR